MNRILALLDRCYDDLAKLVLFADGSGHIINESLSGGAGERVFDFATIAELKRHLTKRAPDARKSRRKVVLKIADEKLIVDGTWNIAPKYKSVLKVNTNLHFQFEKPMPNRWRRFWQKFFLGWEWSEA